MYTKNIYKEEISRLLEEKAYNPALIAKKSFEIYMDHIKEVDKELREILLDIATMENGPEFEMTEEEFKKFLDEM